MIKSMKKQLTKITSLVLVMAMFFSLDTGFFASPVYAENEENTENIQIDEAQPEVVELEETPENGGWSWKRM